MNPWLQDTPGPVIQVLVPVLGRPHRAQPLVDSLRGSTLVPIDMLFLCSPDDDDQIAACRETHMATAVVGWQQGRGDYARKLNWAVAHTESLFVFFAADDLVFHGGWAERCIARWYATGSCVIGTNDLGNSRVVSGRHSTHTLVHRDYLECGTVDQEGVLLHEGYHHNFVDDEFIQTATWRGTYAHATDAVVEHLHPNWAKAPRDATYEIGDRTYRDDRAYFEQRRVLWS